MTHSAGECARPCLDNGGNLTLGEAGDTKKRGGVFKQSQQERIVGLYV